MRRFIPILIFILASCVHVQQITTISGGNSSTLVLTDRIYEPQIKTVRLYSTTPTLLQRTELNPAVTRLGDWKLFLEFDDLTAQRENYYLRIIHCNYNWTKSTLLDLDYLNDYNEFPINNFELSVNTQLPYIHYWSGLPPVKLPGNYVVVVYRGSDRDNIVLSKRFMVFDPRITFLREGSLVGAGTSAQLNQQINFKLNYKNVEIINPLESVNVTIRQNQRWDNLAENIKPSFVRDNIHELEYRFFDDSKMFKGGNEFRFFDLRSLNYPGRNIDRVDRTENPLKFYIKKDKSRTNDRYAQYMDYNGNYIIENYDIRNNNASYYADVQFTLSSEAVNGEVFVTGAFTNWQQDTSNKMTYDSLKKEYKTSVLMKQGWYDYEYIVNSKSLPSYYFEGSHYETENIYEVFVYYRSFQPNADLLLGYILLNENRR